RKVIRKQAGHADPDRMREYRRRQHQGRKLFIHEGNKNAVKPIPDPDRGQHNHGLEEKKTQEAPENKRHQKYHHILKKDRQAHKNSWHIYLPDNDLSTRMTNDTAVMT
ncbi:hypothetical protein HEL47_024405, partial [Escherichia coli]|nr:hypothetical protein [Escherichia coli]